MPDVSLARLRGASLSELERLYAEPRELAVPSGQFRGEHLGWLSSGGGVLLRPFLWLGFDVAPFGVDFERARWFFGPTWLAAGQFRAEPGPSRWRRTDTLRLTYEVSRLPGMVRRWLYDEVKPLSSELCLGIGGINTGHGRGEQFFFALRRIA